MDYPYLLMKRNLKSQFMDLTLQRYIWHRYSTWYTYWSPPMDTEELRDVVDYAFVNDSPMGSG